MFTPHSGNTANTHTAARMPIPHMPTFNTPPPPPLTHVRRFLHVQFAPHLPPATAEFIIETAGIRGTSFLPESFNQFTPSPSPPQLSYAHAHGGRSAAAAWPPTSARLPPVAFPTSAPPEPSPSSYTKNMYTPSGSRSYFDDDDLTLDEEESAAVARAEDQMQRRRPTTHHQHQAAHNTNGTTILTVNDVMTSPVVRY